MGDTAFTEDSTPIDDLSRSDLIGIVHEMRDEMADLQEGWNEAGAAMLRIRQEDRGWRLLNQIANEDEGFALQITQDIAKEASIQASGNPLLKRGFTLRHNNVFGKGLHYEGDIKPRVRRKMETNAAIRTLFSAEAWETNERALYETGNLFIAFNRVTGNVFRVPLSEITDYARNPEDRTDVWYFQRTYSKLTDFATQRSTEVTEWYPVLEHWEDAPRLLSKIGNNPVNKNIVIIDLRVNRPTDGIWGIADCFAAMSYAWAYSEYLRDAGEMLKAFNTIAWKVVGKGKRAAQQAGVQMAGKRRVASTAVMNDGSDLKSMPSSGQVDMNDGLAMAAMTASALEVPLVALTSNSSVAAGSYGAVASLDGPTAAAARARQQKWAGFYSRVFRAMGGPKIAINFPTIVEDPAFRTVASLAVGRSTGALWADEYRAAFLETMNVQPEHDGPPPIEDYAQAQNALGFLQMMQDAVADPDGAAAGDPLSSQGNSGVAGSLNALSADNANRDADRTPGTGAVSR